MISLFLTIGMVSCELEETINKLNSTDDGIEALQEYAIVSKQYQDASNSSDAAVMNAELQVATGLKATTEGPTITIDPMDATSWPKNITVDYGEGITGQDGIVRSGKLKIVSTNWYREEGSVHSTTYEDFYQNGYKIDGTHVATNVGLIEGEGLRFNVTVTNGKVTKDGAVIEYSQNTTRTWVVGSDTPLDIWDDEYTLTGSQNGVSSKGVKYALTITEPLYFVVLSKEISEGKMAVAIDGLPNMELDYTTSTIKVGEQSFPMKK